MIRYKFNDEHKIFEITADGSPITKEMYEHITADLENLIAKHGKIKILEEIQAVGSFPPSIIWKGIKFDMTHLKDISHCAVVTDKGWIKWMTKIVAKFISCEVKIFPLAELDQARIWLREVK
ncbi:MAG TPA: STAS/SEC14 domain-containing protein [Candidatus Nitrosotenuis sp.]|jgi:hypothetical protein|nr:STAS/SEC14 domain-containing protein [Candidatus Nitrosotenuis sp.]